MGDPPPGGLIERFFETAQGQLESEVRAGEILTLDRLNHALAAWLEQSYHHQRHSETGQPPLERYHQGRRFTRHVSLQEVLKYFLRRRRRKVHPDFSDVQLEGLFFQVDPRLRGDCIPLECLIADHLSWPCKRREGRFSFVCPRCGKSLTAVNPRTNPARCFRCEENFNAIDFVMLATQRDFVDAVHFLTDLLPARPSTPPAVPAD